MGAGSWVFRDTAGELAPTGSSYESSIVDGCRAR